MVPTRNACTGRLQQRDLQVQGQLELATEQDPASTKNILQWLRLVLSIMPTWHSNVLFHTLYHTSLLHIQTKAAEFISSFKLMCGHGLLMKTTALVLRETQIEIQSETQPRGTLN